jgi:hypothetical protein
MVGPWTWDHILQEASWIWDNSKNFSAQNREVNLFLNDIVTYVNYTLDHLSLLRPSHLNFKIELRQNPNLSSLKDVPKDLARLMRRNHNLHHPFFSLPDFMNPVYVDVSHQLISLSLTSKDAGVCIQRDLMHYIPHELGSYNKKSNNFFYNDAHYIIYEWADLKSKEEWNLFWINEADQVDSFPPLYAENIIDLASNLIDASVATDLKLYRNLGDRLEEKLTLNHLKPSIKEGIIAHNETLNLSYHFLRDNSGVDYRNYQSLVKYCGDVVLKSIVHPTESIKDFPIKIN